MKGCAIYLLCPDCVLLCPSCAASFIAELTDIIYEEVQADVDKVQQKLEERGESLASKSKRWRRARIRRVVRSGEVIQGLIQQLITKYMAMICPVDGVSPVTDELQEVFRNASERSIKIDGSFQSPIDLLQGK